MRLCLLAVFVCHAMLLEGVETLRAFEDAASANPAMSWTLHRDFRTGADRENPNFDKNNLTGWFFLRTTSSRGSIESRQWIRDGRYVPLSDVGEKLFGYPLDGWVFQAGEQSLSPSVCQLVGTPNPSLRLEPGQILLSPGLDHAVVVGWRCPVVGTGQIDGFFKRAQESSDVKGQVRWYVERGRAPDSDAGFEPVSLASGVIGGDGSSSFQEFHLSDQRLQPGDFLYFVMDADADGTTSPDDGDRTQFDVTITISGAAPSPQPRFETDVVPILAARCQECHNSSTREGRLDLGTVSAMLAGGSLGPAVMRGSPEKSLLMERVLAGEMPPQKEDRLSPEETFILRRWIKGGLQAEEQVRPVVTSIFSDAERNHWAFRRLNPVEPPSISQISKTRTILDCFLLSKLEAHGLTFSPEADRETLLRRVLMDTTGLPPTPKELHEFLGDERVDAYERVVDRLIASPQFGVRWGRYWLDIVGYTDTVSFDEDFGPPGGAVDGKWRYRDYVVKALNADIPYDRFILDQLAGDELTDWRDVSKYSPEIIERLVATGFLRTVQDISDDDSNPFGMWTTVHETVEQTATSFLGLTLHCARCHSHKFEPILQQDYYSLMSLFTPSLNPAKWKKLRERLLPDISSSAFAELSRVNSEIVKQTETLQSEINSLRHVHERRLREEKLFAVPELMRPDLIEALDTAPETQNAVQKELINKFGDLVKVETTAVDAVLTPTEKGLIQNNLGQIAALNSTKQIHGWIHAVYDVGPPPATFLFKRGDFESRGREVPAGFLRILSDNDTESLFSESASSTSSGRRTALARWMTSTSSPASGLVSRVMVNRLWQHLFGRGLAANSENLGLSGTAPTHPELLDWLAENFRKNGWQIKPLIRSMLLSAAYRQRSGTDEHPTGLATDPNALDPANLLLWQMRLRRLDAEALRDAILAASGKLDESLEGPPVPLVYDLKTGAVGEQPLASKTAQRRRSLFLTNRRVYNPSFLSVFDKPNVTSGICQRDYSASALQSLSLMNDPFVIESSGDFADYVYEQAGNSSEQQILRTFELTLSRRPSTEEKQWSRDLLEEQIALFRRADFSDCDSVRKALAILGQTLWGTNDFLYLR